MRPNIFNAVTDWPQVCRLSRLLLSNFGSKSLGGHGVPELDHVKVYSGGIRLDLVYTFKSREHPIGKVRFVGNAVLPADDNRSPTDPSGEECYQGWEQPPVQSVTWVGEGDSSLLAERRIDGMWNIKFIGNLDDSAKREARIFWPIPEVDFTDAVRFEFNRPQLISRLLGGPKVVLRRRPSPLSRKLGQIFK